MAKAARPEKAARPDLDDASDGLNLKGHERMLLLGADRDVFLSAILNPPEPTERLVAALRHWQSFPCNLFPTNSVERSAGRRRTAAGPATSRFLIQKEGFSCARSIG